MRKTELFLVMLVAIMPALANAQGPVKTTPLPVPPQPAATAAVTFATRVLMPALNESLPHRRSCRWR